MLSRKGPSIKPQTRPDQTKPSQTRLKTVTLNFYFMSGGVLNGPKVTAWSNLSECFLLLTQLVVWVSLVSHLTYTGQGGHLLYSQPEVVALLTTCSNCTYPQRPHLNSSTFALTLFDIVSHPLIFPESTTNQLAWVASYMIIHVATRSWYAPGLSLLQTWCIFNNLIIKYIYLWKHGLAVKGKSELKIKLWKKKTTLK